MILDTRRSVIKLKVRIFIAAIIFIVVITIILFTSTYEETFLGMNKYKWSIDVAALYILIIIFNSFRNYNYIYFNDEQERISFKFFSLSVFNQRKNAIEIPRKDFAGYVFKEKYGGLIRHIVLKQKVKSRVAEYPKISLTILTNNELTELLSAFDKIN